jgi:hypothetical protein
VQLYVRALSKLAFPFSRFGLHPWKNSPSGGTATTAAGKINKQEANLLLSALTAQVKARVA